MTFNDSTNNTGIVQDVWFLTGTNSTSFPIEDVTRIANKVYNKLGLLAWRSDNQWNFDDSNKTSFLISTTDLVDGQEDYTIPTTVFDIRGVSILDSSGNWRKLKNIKRENLKTDLAQYRKTKGTPDVYLLSGYSIILKPAPDTTMVTASNGLKIYIARDITEFVSTDTTKEPGFPTPLHQLFPYEIALEYAGVHNLTDVYKYLMAKVVEGRQMFIDYFAHRGGEIKTRIKPRIINYE